MNTQQMIDYINLKIASTSQSDEGTGCFLPITFEKVCQKMNKYEGGKVFEMWNFNKKFLHDQSKECIEYVYTFYTK